MKNINIKMWLVLIGFVLVGTLSPVPIIAGTNNNPGIAPPDSKPNGHSYSEWAATFWQWALGQALSVNPVLDTSGGICSAGQFEFRRVELRIREGGDDEGSDDKAWVGVWYLAGNFGDSSPVRRTCTVPAGQALFFPLIDAFYGAFLSDPPEMRTAKFVRSQVDCKVTSAKVIIDGVLVNNPQQYFLSPQKSLLFDVQLPTDNVAGDTSKQVPELLLSPSADSGIYLFLFPLPPGKHALHWNASQTCPFGAFTQDVTYELTIPPNVPVKAAPIGHGRHIP